MAGKPATHPTAGGSAVGSLGSDVWYQLGLEVWQVSEIGSSTVFWKAWCSGGVVETHGVVEESEARWAGRRKGVRSVR